MNGAQALMKTLVDSGVTACFTNPGTSEMHFVAALDSAPEMRAVLGLFEGVATGAADGYARIAGKPAATLLHLGPGLGNGLANLHNARKGKVPVVNIVGDHATHHRQYDTQLQSDIDAIASNVSTWIRTSQSTSELAKDVAEAVAAASGPPGQVATLVLPADVSWSEGGVPSPPVTPTPRSTVSADVIDQVAKALRSGEPAAILLGCSTLLEPGLVAAAKVAESCGARLYAETFPTRLTRGAGVPAIDRIAYLPDMAKLQLEGLRHLILVDAKAPVSFFAYPGQDSYLVPEGCQVHELAGVSDDSVGALVALAEAVGAQADPTLAALAPPPRPTGELTAMSVCQAIGAVLPEGAIISDESQTCSLFLPGNTSTSPRHDLLALTGGAIGQGLPVAVGAAVAAPDRPVLALEADGSAMYTIQSLWTMAREELDITVVLFNNRSYSILNLELNRVGATEVGPKAKAQLDLSNPDLDFVALAEGMGVPASRAVDAEDFTAKLAAAIAAPGPHLIEVVVPPIF
ncbi:MAG TPA: acetolactate synthase large subunit [Nocardioidaceae bacterium]|nr:acetolactate synthase large subunit [Nocardioidaceae bacterium]